MLNKTAFLALFLAPALAHADAGSDLGDFGYAMKNLKEFGADLPSSVSVPDAKRCYDVKIGADDTVQSQYFKDEPGAVEVPDSGYPAKYAIKGKAVKAFCDRYRDLAATVEASLPLEQVWSDLEADAIRHSSVESYDWYLAATDPSYPGAGSSSSKTCSAAIDKAIADGARADLAIKFGRKEDLTLDQLRERCNGGSEEFRGKVQAWGKAKYEEIASKYKQAGIKGKRLDLFVYTDGSMLEKGCTRFATDPRKMKKAKKLFQWSEADDGTITVRTFKFKGDTYSASEKQYLKTEKAYRGCK